VAVEVARALRRRSIINLITDINHELGDYIYFTRLMWALGHIVNILLVADESEINLPNVGWLTLTESEELKKITIDTSEFKKEYDSEINHLLRGIISRCTLFGAKVLLLKSFQEVNDKIPEIAGIYRLAREGAYR